MANININKTIDDLDQNAPAPAQPWTMPTPRPAPRLDWPTAATRYGFILLFVALAWWQADEQIRWWIPRLVVVLAVAWFVVQRLLVVHIGGVPVWAFFNNVRGTDIVTPMGEAAIEHARRALPSVSSYSPSIQHAPAPKALPSGEVIDSTATTVDTTAALLVPDSDWLRWIDRTPHLLIAGRTEAGKTTLAEAILAERIQSGDEMLIFDPHYQPGKWHNLPAIGGGRDFDGILSMLPILIGELDDRYKRFNDGMKTEQFRRLTVLLDEVPAIIGETYETTPSGGKRIIDDRWLRFAKRLGSEARKVRMSVILLSQSTLVDDLLINTAHRENFIRIGLGDKARALLSEEKDTKRRQAGYDLLRGQAHPAAMEYRSDYHVLNTERVPDLAQRAVGHLATIWEAPTPAEPPRLAQRAVAKAQAPTVARASVQIKAPTSGPVFQQERIELYLKKLVLDGKNRADIRAWCEANGLRFDNGKLTKVRSDLGLSEK